ncbi:MAG TPA: hypothetical protein VEA69_15325 [Tepidisphaeraceae bacterium]|nr:hypothetical protein [Tepidisphaeraceae bacterium]
MMTRLALIALFALTVPAFAADPFVVYEGKEGPGKGKHVVLISGDEEYRSEEALPQLGKILAERHGFKCTVLFAVDDKGEINPNHGTNIPGLEALGSADLMVIFTRFRALPDDQMKHVDAFLKAGKPVIGLRTATHAFAKLKAPYDKYNNGYNGPEQAWKGGFGSLVLGEKWVAHHGGHMTESTRALIAPGAKGHPILSGIDDGAIWGGTDVYTVNLPLPGDSKALLLGQVVKRAGERKSPDVDPNFGMAETDKEPVGPEVKRTTDKKTGKVTETTVNKNDPMMPVAWVKSYQLPDGKAGKAFTTTMGSSTDLANEPFRRLLVNATYSLLDLKVPEKADVTVVGEYKPSAYRGGGYKKGVKPADLK